MSLKHSLMTALVGLSLATGCSLKEMYPPPASRLLVQQTAADTPGTFRIKTTQDVTDRFGQGVVLLPVDTVFLGSMEGQARYGQERISAQVTMAILPDGTAVNFK